MRYTKRMDQNARTDADWFLQRTALMQVKQWANNIYMHILAKMGSCLPNFDVSPTIFRGTEMKTRPS